MKRSTLKRMILVTCVSGATLLQTVSCAQIAADAVGGISASILNSYLRSVISDWLGVGGGLSLTGLTT